MNTTIDRQRNQLKGVLLRWAKRSVPLQQSLRTMTLLLGPVNDRNCLCVVAEHALVGFQIMERGGRWECVGVLEHPGLVAECLFGSSLTTMKEGKLPFPDECFDVVMLDHVLEYFEDVGTVIGECHRVLKPTGSLVAQSQLAKTWSLVEPFRRILGLSSQHPKIVHKGFSESELFGFMKNGFDTEEVLTWSRFFVEMVETKSQMFVALTGGGEDRLSGQVGDDERMLMTFRRILNVYSILYPFGILAHWLHKLLIFHRGHRLAFRARRRPWKPRVTPTLKDGRSIADAAINTKIGTAGPF